MTSLNQDLGFSKWTLQPIDPAIASTYSKYTRNQVKSVSPIAIFSLFIVCLIAGIICLVKGYFKTMLTHMAPEIVYFFSTGILMVVFAAFALISKKWLLAIELIIPVYSILMTAFAAPTWYEDPFKPKLVKGATLLQYNNFIYIMNIFLTLFCTSNYSVSVAGRSILVVNNLNLTIRRYTAGDATLLPVLFNFFITITLMEAMCIYINREKVKLFLENERSKQKDR